jgi:predicted transcriptional regulator
LKHRSKEEIAALILEAIVNTNRPTQTMIMYKAYLTHVQLKQFLASLMEKGLIEYHNLEQIYTITDVLMKETSKLRKLITKKGTLEILIPLCCTTNPVRYIKFRNTLKGFSSKTLAARLKELQRNGILERQPYNETPTRVEYKFN